MPSHITHYTNTRSPSLLDTITSDGVAVDLTGDTVKLQMRAVGSSTLKVDANASIVSAPAGTVRYDWAAADVNTSGFYTAWWHVTLAGGTTQDTPEFLVEIRDHALAGQTYMSVEELKDSLSLQGQSYADVDLQRALLAASRAIDQQTGRRFYPDAVDTTRKYVPMNPGFCAIDDLSTFTNLTDSGGAAWTLGTDFYLEPLNAVAEGEAYTGIRSIWKPFLWDASSTSPSSPGPDARISVTGKFGWTTAPPEIVQATGILAPRFAKRAREAAFGVFGIGMDGSAVRITATDPDVAALIQPYVRMVAF